MLWQKRSSSSQERESRKLERVDPQMKLELEISGGFAPSVTSGHYSLDVASLSQDARKQIEELVNDLLAAPRPRPNPKLRDAMSYELTVVSGDLTQSVVRSEE